MPERGDRLRFIHQELPHLARIGHDPDGPVPAAQDERLALSQRHQPSILDLEPAPHRGRETIQWHPQPEPAVRTERALAGVAQHRGGGAWGRRRALGRGERVQPGRNHQENDRVECRL